MKVLVPIKRVVDANVNVRVKGDGSGIDLTNVKMAVNPFCEIAVEEALRIKEASHADEVIACTVGPPQSQEQIRVCLALGADRGIHITHDGELEPLTIAKLLKAIYEKEQPGIVIFGKQSIDGDNGQTGQMFAQLTDLPQATFASELKILSNRVEITREVDGGLQTIAAQIPLVVTTDLRLNTPRFASLPNIMKAKSKPIDKYTPDDFGINVSRHTETLRISPPPSRLKGVMVKDIKELIDKLKNEAKVI